MARGDAAWGPGIPLPEETQVRKRHIVMLSEPERAQLHTLIGQGAAPARALTHARILLKANQGEPGPGWTDRAIAEALEVVEGLSRETVRQVLKQTASSRG